MKPFNLERALAGDPVVTRDGRKVLKVLDGRHPKVGDSFKVMALIEGEDCYLSFGVDGKYWEEEDHPHDLFMVPKKRGGWVNVYEGKHQRRAIGGLYTSEQEASGMAEYAGKLITTVRIEWEE